jgi:hypothetical protein
MSFHRSPDRRAGVFPPLGEVAATPRNMKRLLSFLAALLCTSAGAQNTFSPKLFQFLRDHPTAARALSNATTQAASGKTIQVYYFYASDASSPRSHHHYIGDQSVVGIFVQENQPPCDECISILYELVNSRGEKQFLKLFEMAKSRAITKKDFVMGLLREEFEAVKITRDVITKWDLRAETVAGCQTYQYFTNAPKHFEEFLTYARKASQGQVEKAYERLYENIQNTARQ